MKFKKGEGGRPKGVTNKNTREIKNAATALVEDPKYLASLQHRLMSGKAPHMETLLFHYAYGKPKDITEHQGAIKLRVMWEQ